MLSILFPHLDQPNFGLEDMAESIRDVPDADMYMGTADFDRQVAVRQEDAEALETRGFSIHSADDLESGQPLAGPSGSSSTLS